MMFLLYTPGSADHTIPKQQFLLQQFAESHIVEFPDLKNEKLTDWQRLIVQMKNSDAGLSQNHYSKKIRCRAETRNVLFAPIRSTVDFHVRIQENSTLDMGYAVDDMHSGQQGISVEFKILIKAADKDDFHQIFKKDLNLSNPKAGGWSDVTLHLGQYQGKVIIRFMTTASVTKEEESEFIFAYWSNPFITAGKGDKKKNNLILISLDTLRADHLELFRDYRATAPQLALHAQECVVFKNVWSQWCWTLESHVSIMTGLYGVEHKIPDYYHAIPPTLITLAELMKKSGYLTAAFTGAAKVSAQSGLCKGFDSYFDHEANKVGTQELENNWQRAKIWLTENGKKDFFLFFHTYQIHAPYPTGQDYYDSFYRTGGENDQAYGEIKAHRIGNGSDRIQFKWLTKPGFVTKEDQDFIQMYKDLYDGSIRFTNDHFLKDLFSCLKSLGIYDNTTIVIVSDHGEEFFEHERFYHYDGLYEEYIHVPLIIKFPQSQYGGRVIEDNVETIDILPTLLDEFHISPDRYISGQSLMPLIKNNATKAPADQRFIFSQSRCKFAVKKQNIKVIFRALISDVLRNDIPRIEIFDLKNDPQEQNAIKRDDLEGYERYYRELYSTVIMKKRGIHIVFPTSSEGKHLKARISLDQAKGNFAYFSEIGVVRGDLTRFNPGQRDIEIDWQLKKWQTSLIITPRDDNLKITLRVTIDDKEYQNARILESDCLKREGQSIELGEFRASDKSSSIDGDTIFHAKGIIVFAQKSGGQRFQLEYYPQAGKSNLEKLKALGYIE